jgi:death on curing protein
MKYLTAKQILFLHARLIAETGRSQGLRDPGMLLSALGRPRASFEGQELYPELTSKAAAQAHSLVTHHPFLDGNKRVGIAAAAIFLQINGKDLTASNQQLLCLQ